MTELFVWREIYGSYELVGTLRDGRAGLEFSYAAEYLGDPRSKAVSRVFPLQEAPFGRKETSAFFGGLLPEGSLRNALAVAARASTKDVGSLLARLSNESSGALVFTVDRESPARGMSYEPIRLEVLQGFCNAPREVALSLNMRSRLSLAGAQSKVGLHHEGDDLSAGWFIPTGSAPSTFILKAEDGAFPGLAYNEAICMSAARSLGFDVPDFALLDVGGEAPLFIVERYDRLRDDSRVFPRRLHQEDFCQALGIDPELKYEPKGAGYPELGSWLLAMESANPFGDKVCFFESILFDALVGNCENHLKNYSLLYGDGWSSAEMAPLYDLVCTTLYPALDTEMGVSLCPSRRVQDTTWSSIEGHADAARLPIDLITSDFLGMADELPGALEVAGDELAALGFPAAKEVSREIIENRTETIERLAREARGRGLSL